MNTKQHLTIFTILVLALLAGVLVGSGATMAQSPFNYVVALVRGEVVQVTCTDANRLRADRQNELEIWLTCGRVATATPAPQPTTIPAPQPTATPVAGDMADMVWHAPGLTHGDRPAHEHGDAPPVWLLQAYGYTDPSQLMLFTHTGSTPGENVLNYKHTAFKGFAGTFATACGTNEWFSVNHLDTNPAGHTSRFHSYQLWVKDCQGGISHFSGWLDFGTGNMAGPQKVVICGIDSGIRPIMLVNQAGCDVRFENWYARAGGSGGWAPDFGFNINPTYYDIGGGDPLNPADWQPIGGSPRNFTRRIEWAWYAGRQHPTGAFFSTQWGDLVSGANDPVCGTQRTIGGKTYTVACIEQFIAPTLPEISFDTVQGPNRNSMQRQFPAGSGVVFPN